MQQYRVNFPLLIGLVVGTMICSGAVYGVWRFQIERKSGILLSEAEKSAAAGEIRDARDHYGQYLSIHPEDSAARFKYANTLIDVTEKEDATAEDLGLAARVLETTLRNRDLGDQPEAKELRRRLIELYGRDSVRNFGAGLEHLDLSLASDPNEPELQALRAKYLARSGNLDEAIKYSSQLIGYDPQENKFDIKKATAPHVAEVYSSLAAIVRSKENKPELAERIIDQMVEVNPKSAEAYVQRGRLHSAWGNPDGARADAEKAYQLKPEDTEALLFIAETASVDEEFDKAREYIDKAKKLHPDEVRIYRAAALLEMKDKHYDKAMAQIEEGIKNVSGPKTMELLFFKAELQIPQLDVKGARQTIGDLQKLRNLRPDVIDYFEARILLAEGKWQDASEALNKLRSKVVDFGRERVMEVDYSLGLCYERLGKPDLARDQYELVVQQDPQNEPALAGIQRVDAQRGVAAKDRGGDELSKLAAEEIKKPKDQRNTAKLIAALREMAEKRKLDPTTVKLMEAQIMMMSEDYDTAGKALAEANQLSPKNLQVMRAAVALARANPQMGPAVAMDRLSKVVAEFGDLPALRVDKADILIQQNKDQQDKEPLKHALATLLTGIDQWTVPQKVELWGGMAGRYLNLNMIDEARQYLTLSADNQPNELPLRMALFSLALDAGDDAGMQEAQDKILQIVKDKNDSAWLYAEARRRLMLLRRGRLEPDSLAEIRKLANQALQQRPDWFELHALLAEVELLANNGALALQYYDQAEELGRPAPGRGRAAYSPAGRQRPLRRRRQAPGSHSRIGAAGDAGPAVCRDSVPQQSNRSRPQTGSNRHRNRSDKRSESILVRPAIGALRPVARFETGAPQRNDGRRHQGHAAGHRIAARIPGRLVRFD